MGSCQGQLNKMVSSTPSVSNLDTLDIDQFINYDPSPVLPNASYSPESSRSKSIATPFQPNEYTNDLLLAPPSQQTFAGPSHQYELHKQQTGLPVGALANTFAVNQSDHIVYGHAQRMFGASPADGYFGTNNTDDIFDFNTAPSQLGGTDMDIDFVSPLYDADFINPTAVGGQETSTTSTPSKQRAWPGMHQQQAALAKAQAQAQAQQHRHQPSSQQQSNASSSRHSSQRPSSSVAAPKDPIVEERISRLLNQMRHNSVASSSSDNTPSNTQGTFTNLSRAKKDEEDMDEDERLLASEEGKKLSSKERRQLRNKVSARAFRSRRKEYIGQLEGEIAAKSAEADDLRAKNQELMTENKHLTDLTRMLLESSAFNSFLNELSGTDGQVDTSSISTQQNETAPKVEESQPEPPKDINPHQPSSQVQSDSGSAQIGMALMPETYYNFNGTNAAWADSMDSSLYDAQVYAVTSMPEGPADDHFGGDFLSGKSFSSLRPFINREAKADHPAMESLSSHYEEAKAQVPMIGDSSPADTLFGESDPAFALYDEAPTSFKTPMSHTPNTPRDSTLSEKSPKQLHPTTVEESSESGEVSAATQEKFRRFCAAMEAPSRRVAAVVSHLR